MGAFEHFFQVVFDVLSVLFIKVEDVLEAEGEVGDIEFHVVTFAVGFGLALAAAEEDGEASSTLLKGEGDFSEDVGVAGHGVLAFAGEGNPYAGDVDHEDHGALREGAFGLGEAISFPVDPGDGLGDGAGSSHVEKGNAVGETEEADGGVGPEFVVGFGFGAGESDLDLEGVAAVHGGTPGEAGVEVGVDFFAKPGLDFSFADGGEAVGGRAHQLGFLEGLVEDLDVSMSDLGWFGLGIEAGGFADFEGGAVADPGEIGSEGGAEGSAVGVLEHLHEEAEFEAVGMGFDFEGGWRKGLGAALVGDAGFVEGFLAGFDEGDTVMESEMGIDDGALFEEFVHGELAAHVGGFHLDGDGSAVGLEDGVEAGAFGVDGVKGWGPVDFGVAEDGRLVVAGVDLHGDAVGGFPGFCAGEDLGGCAGGELAIHASGADADTLLAPGHAEAVKFGAVEEFGEDFRDLVADDAGAVVLDGDPEPVLGELFKIDGDFGEDACLFAGVERVVDRFLDGGKEGAAGAVEA